MATKTFISSRNGTVSHHHICSDTVNNIDTPHTTRKYWKFIHTSLHTILSVVSFFFPVRGSLIKNWCVFMHQIFFRLMMISIFLCVMVADAGTDATADADAHASANAQTHTSANARTSTCVALAPCSGLTDERLFCCCRRRRQARRARRTPCVINASIKHSLYARVTGATITTPLLSPTAPVTVALSLATLPRSMSMAYVQRHLQLQW